MRVSQVVLTVGLEPILLKSRCEVLRSVGYRVIAAGSPEEAADRFLQEKIDLVLLCHTVPSVAKQRLVRRLRDHASQTPIISVGSHTGQIDEFVDATVDSDPKILLAEVQELLQKHSKTS